MNEFNTAPYGSETSTLIAVELTRKPATFSYLARDGVGMPTLIRMVYLYDHCEPLFSEVMSVAEAVRKCEQFKSLGMVSCPTSSPNRVWWLLPDWSYPDIVQLVGVQ